jgi:hypothetical protein
VIACGICGAENDEFATVCRTCRSFLQAKVDTLDLFSTLWGLMEAPQRTFRRIVLSRHKNYVIPLCVLFGAAMVYDVLWLGNLGSRFAGLGQVLLFGLLAGIVAGFLLIGLLALLLTAGGRAIGGKGTFRRLFAVTAYAWSPVAVSLWVTLPIEIGIFGIYFFDHNPSPYVINPVSYIIVSVMHGLAVLAALILLAIGTKVVHGFSIARGATVIAFVIGALGAGAVYGIGAH